MKAIILAAGRGSRMKDWTDDRPKCLVELKGKPLLEWQMEALRGAGIDEIAVVTGYRKELLDGWGTARFHNARWSETNMVASLSCADEWLRTESCIVSYSDIFYDSGAVSALLACQDALAVLYDPNWLDLWRDRFGDPLLDAETFRLADDGTILEIGSRPKSVEEVQGQYMGLLRFTPAGWRGVAAYLSRRTGAERDRLDMTAMLSGLIGDQEIAVSAVPYGGRWGEVDRQEDLLLYERRD